MYIYSHGAYTYKVYIPTYTRALSRVRGVGSVKWTQERRTGRDVRRDGWGERREAMETGEGGEGTRRVDKGAVGAGVVRFVDVRERSSHIDRG